MARDHDVKLLLAVSTPLLDDSVPLAEMITAWNAIRAAIFRLGVTKLWIEGDAFGIILAIKKGLGAGGYAANLPLDINAWLYTPEEWRVSHIFCERNAPTDFMVVGESKDIAAEYVMTIYLLRCTI